MKFSAAAVAAGPKQRRRRRKRKEGGVGTLCRKKRNLTTEQTRLLEMSFGHEHKLASARKDRLAAELGLDPRQVAVWFQNRRARWKSKQLEGGYSCLKDSHDINMLEKCRLEAEVIFGIPFLLFRLLQLLLLLHQTFRSIIDIYIYVWFDFRRSSNLESSWRKQRRRS